MIGRGECLRRGPTRVMFFRYFRLFCFGNLQSETTTRSFSRFPLRDRTGQAEEERVPEGKCTGDSRDHHGAPTRGRTRCVPRVGGRAFCYFLFHVSEKQFDTKKILTPKVHFRKFTYRFYKPDLSGSVALASTRSILVL